MQCEHLPVGSCGGFRLSTTSWSRGRWSALKQDACDWSDNTETSDGITCDAESVGCASALSCAQHHHERQSCRVSCVVEPLEGEVGHPGAALRAGWGCCSWQYEQVSRGCWCPPGRSCAGAMVQIRGAGMAAHSHARDIRPRSVALCPVGSRRMPCLGWEHSEGHRLCSVCW